MTNMKLEIVIRVTAVCEDFATAEFKTAGLAVDSSVTLMLNKVVPYSTASSVRFHFFETTEFPFRYVLYYPVL